MRRTVPLCLAFLAACGGAPDRASISSTSTAVVQINSGGGAAGSFTADGLFSGGSTYATSASVNTSGVTNPAPQVVYQTERYGNFSYTIGGLTAGASYTVRLHFAEIWWTTSGSRLFNVSINVTQVLTSFDIFAAAGGALKALVREFSAAANASGQIVIQYTTVKDNAKSSGIEVHSGSNAPPTVATAASATPNPVGGTTTSLGVLGADDGGEASLVYTWAATGTPPAPVSFSPNGTNAAKSSTATFAKAGTYTLQATIADASGQTATSSVTVIVSQTLTAIAVSPASATVAPGATQQFTATANDQFGKAMSTQPAFAWTVSGGGTISSTGLFTAGPTAGGPFMVTAAAAGTSGTATVTISSSTAAGTVAVLEHHGGSRRDGLYVAPALTTTAAAGLHLDTSFQASVAGAMYAQPLYVPGAGGVSDVVIAVTEQNNVAAFDAKSGATIWQRQLGTPVPLASLPCGNIDPLGITGTPIVDPVTRTLYLDAMTTPDGGTTKRHLVFALSVDDGSTRSGWPLDVAAVLAAQGRTFDAAAQNQRGALSLVGGTLYVPYGGHSGDCGDFHGWLVAIATTNPPSMSAWETPAGGGGIWAVSGASSDAGQVFVATGNTFGATTWSGGEAVLRFAAGSPIAASPADFFTPTNWQTLDATDTDIGSTGPVLLDLPGATTSQLAIGMGKDGYIYVLDRTHLGGIGGALTIAQVSTSGIINAAAAYTTPNGTYVVFRGSGVGCPAGQSGDLVAVRLLATSPPGVQVAWCALEGGWGSPIVTTIDGSAGAIVWAVGATGSEQLRGFDGDTGQVVFGGGNVNVGSVRRYTTPIYSAGRIFVGVDGGVRAFTP